jgi:hypothetical protein
MVRKKKVAKAHVKPRKLTKKQAEAKKISDEGALNRARDKAAEEMANSVPSGREDP